MTIGLCMIVRNETRVIERCLASARPHIQSWLIVDTGSTDDTPTLVARALDGIPGQLEERPWRNFGANRTEALELAYGTADHLLLLDADDTIEAEADFAIGDEPVYMITVHDGGPEYAQPRLVSGERRWRYEGVTHEYLTSTEQPVPLGPTLEGFAIRHHCDGSRRPRKFHEDLLLLRAWVAEHPDDPRATFYLANTLRDLGRPDEALPLYWRRANMGGWAQEAETAARQAIRIEAGNLEAVGVPTPVAMS